MAKKKKDNRSNNDLRNIHIKPQIQEHLFTPPHSPPQVALSSKYIKRSSVIVLVSADNNIMFLLKATKLKQTSIFN
jgi:hypothetical protein